jgi:hypothetical protein
MPLRVPYRGERSVEIKSRDKMASSSFSAAVATVGCVMEQARQHGGVALRHTSTKLHEGFTPAVDTFIGCWDHQGHTCLGERV